MSYYPVEARIAPLTSVRRERLLPAPGEVLVRVGELVGPVDVIARCQLPGEVQVVDVSRALGVRRERAAKYVCKAVGDTVQVDDVLAAPGGLLGRLKGSCRATVNGQVVEVRNALILIEVATTIFELSAHLKGQVSNVMPNWGAVISATGALVQGVWGSGGEAGGVLKMLVDSPHKPLRARSIDVGCHGTLVVGGRILDREVLEQAAEAKVRGVIAGSVDAGLCSFLQSLPFPVMITEGFGNLPMSQQVFSLLHSNMGREATLSADTRTRWGTRRPEILVPRRTDEDLPPEDHAPLPLEVGAQVRVLRAPYLGAIGTVKDLPAQPRRVESGARLPVAVVDVEDGEPVLVPLANLEMIR